MRGQAGWGVTPRDATRRAEGLTHRCDGAGAARDADTKFQVTALRPARIPWPSSVPLSLWPPRGPVLLYNPAPFSSSGTLA